MEQWKPIPGYEGLYDASNLGNIRTSPGKVTSNARYDRRVWASRVMRKKYQRRSSGGRDARVSLWKDGHEQTWLVARLVAMAWCEGYAEGMTVNHIDGNPENNCIDNLEWISLAENIRHGFETGLYAAAQKPVMLIDSTGKEYCFPSMAEASRYLGHGEKYVSEALLKRNGCAHDTANNPYTAVRM